MASSADPHGLLSDHEKTIDKVVEIPTQITTRVNSETSAYTADITRLQAEMAQLQATNSSLNQQIQTLILGSSGVLFPRFKDLSAEIRCMIWTIALTAPQIHIIGHSFYSRSRVNDIMETCREARELGFSLDLTSFRVRESSLGAGPKQYMNYEEDTVWHIDDRHNFLRDRVRFYCSRCPPGRNTIGRDENSRHLPTCQCSRRLGGLAFNHSSDWAAFRLCNAIHEYHWAIVALPAFHPRKLYIIVNHDLPIKARDIVFVQPPYYDADDTPLPVDQAKQKWEDLAVSMTQTMESFKEMLAQEVMQRIGRGEEDDKGTKWLQRFLKWMVPSVHYVDTQSVSRQRDWGFTDYYKVVWQNEQALLGLELPSP